MIHVSNNYSVHGGVKPILMRSDKKKRCVRMGLGKSHSGGGWR